jgi:hypothetical protein
MATAPVVEESVIDAFLTTLPGPLLRECRGSFKQIEEYVDEIKEKIGHLDGNRKQQEETQNYPPTDGYSDPVGGRLLHNRRDS